MGSARIEVNRGNSGAKRRVSYPYGMGIREASCKWALEDTEELSGQAGNEKGI